MAIDRDMGNRKGESQELHTLGRIAMQIDDNEEAEALFRDYVRIRIEIGSPLEEWFVENGYTDPEGEWDFPPEDT